MLLRSECRQSGALRTSKIRMKKEKVLSDCKSGTIFFFYKSQITLKMLVL